MAKTSRSNGNSGRSQDLQIYEKRWQALDATMIALGEHYSYLPDFPRKQSLLYLLKSLQAFAAGQFHFFYYGLDHNNPERLESDPLLELSQRFPTAFLLESVLDQIGNDLEIVQRVADQRMSA